MLKLFLIMVVPVEPEVEQAAAVVETMVLVEAQAAVVPLVAGVVLVAVVAGATSSTVTRTDALQAMVAQALPVPLAPALRLVTDPQHPALLRYITSLRVQPLTERLANLVVAVAAVAVAISVPAAPAPVVVATQMAAMGAVADEEEALVQELMVGAARLLFMPSTMEQVVCS